MNGHSVGVLSRPSGGGLVFNYDYEWQKSEGGRPISLSLPLYTKQHNGNVVYNYFDNLLPDGSEIRTRIQRRFGCETSHPFDLLSSIGSDCIGAIQLSKEIMDIPDVKNVRAKALTEADITGILRDYQNAPLGMSKKINEFRISIAGAQEKTGLLWYKNKWHYPFGTTPTSHILKLPIGVLKNEGIDLSDSCENEWICMSIARAFGLPTADVFLQNFEDVKTLVVKRFDRKWSHDGKWLIRLPQEDLCQALGYSPGLKYESDGGPGIKSIMDLLMQSKSSNEDRAVFIKTQILFWLLAAIDGHAKNFSIKLLNRGNFQLTPLYDIMTAYPLIVRNQLPIQKLKLAIAVYGTKRKYYSYRKIEPRHWLTTAVRIKYPNELIKKNLEEMFDMIDTVIEQVSLEIPTDFPDYIAESTFSGMRKMKDKFYQHNNMQW